MTTPIAIPADQLLLSAPLRELILLAGPDGVGKTTALIALADFISQLTPGARFSVIDTENKFRATLASWGSVPPNLSYYKVETMNDAVAALDTVLSTHTPGDWLAVESMARIWERAQDCGYGVITGTDKAAYMEKRREESARKLPVTPQPDQLWSIIKREHDAGFLDRLCNADDLNVILTTTITKPRAERSNRKENADRVALRAEFGIDLNLDGAPRLPYYVQTLLLLGREQGQVTCQVLRDNGSKLDNPAVTFAVPTRRDFGMQLYAETGR